MFNSKISEDIVTFMNVLSSLNDKLSQLEKTSTTEAHNNKLMSTEEAAAFLGVTTRTLYNYRKQVKLPYHQIGSKILYSEQDLMEFANRFKVGPKTTEI